MQKSEKCLFVEVIFNLKSGFTKLYSKLKYPRYSFF
jgi:hypothetical protein